MKKTTLVLAAAAALGLAAIAAPAPAQARGGFGPALAGRAVIGGPASSAYFYDPSYLFFHGYAPAYDEAPDAYGAYIPAYYDFGGYAPAYYGHRHRRVFRPAYAYYRGPRYYGGWHHRWHRHW